MSIQESLEEIQSIQSKFLEFLESDGNDDYNFSNLQTLFNNQKNLNCKPIISLFFHLITKIANNHHKNNSFYEKIDKVLAFFKIEIQNNFSQREIFNIFKSNKRIILFLIEEKYIVIDKYILDTITSEKYVEKKYPQYFSPEIKQLENEDWFPKKDPFKMLENYHKYEWLDDINKELPNDFYENRKKGENDNFICQLIQKDSIDEFIVYMNRNNISVNLIINESIYETNSFLLKTKNITLFEYAAFNGSIQIFNYLRFSNAKINPIIWICAIHGKNAEIIHLIEEYKIKPNQSFDNCFMESVKCHHNDIANYIQELYLQKTLNSEKNVILFLKNYNFAFLKNDFIYENAFEILCKYDYCSFVDIILKETKIDIKKIPNFII